MLLSCIWLLMLTASLLCGAATGHAAAVSAAVTEGAGAAVTLVVGLAGAMALWSAVLEVMAQSGLTDALSRLLRPLLGHVYPNSFRDPDCAAALSANFSANLLGLGNAATPAGLRAARLMADGSGVAGDELCRLVVMNTASVQLLPATVAAVRAALGSAAPFDILPCVWLTSLCSVGTGLLCARLLERLAVRR
ncbi:MAG: spore maturation protein A [Oscillospiraceae bacterium]|nr:spore maturation protein A [Oscillospiraceae bacterium]